MYIYIFPCTGKTGARGCLFNNPLATSASSTIRHNASPNPSLNRIEIEFAAATCVYLFKLRPFLGCGEREREREGETRDKREAERDRERQGRTKGVFTRQKSPQRNDRVVHGERPVGPTLVFLRGSRTCRAFTLLFA